MVYKTITHLNTVQTQSDVAERPTAFMSSSDYSDKVWKLICFHNRSASTARETTEIKIQTELKVLHRRVVQVSNHQPSDQGACRNQTLQFIIYNISPNQSLSDCCTSLFFFVRCR